MNGVLTTWKRETLSYIYSPVSYVILVLFYVWRGFEIGLQIRMAGVLPMEREQFAIQYLTQASSQVLLLMVPPILTMRCFAEEKRTGSLEVLLTAPVRDIEVVVGKWLAACTFYVVLWLPAVLLLFLMQGGAWLDVSIPIGPVLSGLLGILLVGSMLLAMGCFTSSLTDNQLLASMSAMILTFALLFGPRWLQAELHTTGIAARVDDGTMAAWLDWLQGGVLVPLARQIDVMDHLGNWFLRGLLNTGHIAFYLAGTAFFLFLTLRSLEARRWR